MFDEPEEETPAERIKDPQARAQSKFDEFRMHAELAAVFEACRKFGASIKPDLAADDARELQKAVAKLEKAKLGETPVVAEASMPDTANVLGFAQTRELSTGDYHIYRRPGETMIARWLAGEQVDAFYTRLQAHFDAALKFYREEERQSHGWKQDEQTLAYLDALDKIEANLAERYLRPVIQKVGISVLSTQTADELDILHLADVLMGVDASEIVGEASAPPDAPTEQDRAWYFKLFSLRGLKDGVERMCFFAFMQKTDETW